MPVASATGSGECPACGEKVVLQMSGIQNERRALLVQREEISEAGLVSAVPLPYLPRALTKSEIDRQRRDPESRVLLAKLKMGFGGLIFLIAAMVVLAGDRTFEEEVVEQDEIQFLPQEAKEERKVAEVEAPVVKKVGSGGVNEFEVLFRERPSRPVVLRVWATEGTRYGGVFGDSEWLRCVDLKSANDAEGRVLRAYVVRKSDAGGAVDFLLRQAGSERQQWTVKVRYPPDAEEPNQVWLEELVSGSWALARGQ